VNAILKFADPRKEKQMIIASAQFNTGEKSVSVWIKKFLFVGIFLVEIGLVVGFFVIWDRYQSINGNIRRNQIERNAEKNSVKAEIEQIKNLHENYRDAFENILKNLNLSIEIEGNLSTNFNNSASVGSISWFIPGSAPAEFVT
jgi:hypothetical protein